jgi:dihydroneopterin aldolase/2-amino-4-hydroxy-6-hydroxymethyldihydropteridine diphosphokinase
VDRPDRIELRGLRVLGVHGALPEEQDRAQPFEVDLDVEADLSAAGASDHLHDTVDYGAVADVVAGVVAGERFRLLERLAERLAEEVMATDRRVQAVTVTVRKLRPPVPVDLGSAGVRITRRRAPTTVTGPGVGSTGGRRRAFLSLGSNLGDRMGTLRTAVAGLPDVVAVSPVYETEPVGGPDDQPPYLNLVVELATALSPRRLLEVAQRLEAAAGRVRAERFGPRVLDVDVLLVGDEEVDEPDLIVPHPRMAGRRFVVAPLADIAPDLVAPDLMERTTGEVRRLGSLEDDERHPPDHLDHLSGPERGETT